MMNRNQNNNQNGQGAPRKISIGDILQNKNCEPRPGDFIQVQVVWSSGITKQGKKMICNFVFADDVDYICGVIFVDDGDVHAKNVCQKLKPGTRHRIANFQIKRSSNIFDVGLYTPLREQNTNVILKKSTSSITTIPLDVEVVTNFLGCLPFNFTKLEEVDYQPDESLIDVIGCTEEVTDLMKSKSNKCDYKRVQLGNSRKADDSHSVIIALFGNHIKIMTKIRKKNPLVFAFLNVKVSEFRNEKSLSTSAKTIIIEIDRTLSKLPLEYHQASFVTSLFPKTRKSGRMSQSMASNESLVKTPVENLTAEKNSNTLENENTTNLGTMEATLPKPGTSRVAEANTSPGVTPPKRLRTSIPQTDVEIEITNENGSEVSHNEDQSDRSSTNGNTAPAALAENTEDQEEDDDNTRTKELYDFLQQFKPLKVKVTPTNSFLDIGKNAYSMRSSPRGVALIIHNSHFPHKNEDAVRKGGVHDALNLKDFLSFCKFNVTIKPNVKSTDLKKVITEFKEEVTAKYSSVDALFLAVLSHGSYGHVEMVDGVLINLHDDIVHQFDEINYPLMQGKPKVLVIQTCQNFVTLNSPIKNVFPPPKRNAGGLKNMIVCFPTSPGSKSLRDIHLGSHFIYVLVDTLMKNAHTLDFISIMEEVQEGLKRVKYEGNELLSCTWTPYNFHKKFYFNPGL